MFISYEFIKYLDYDQETQQYSYLYKIIDSEFEEEMGTPSRSASQQAGLYAAAVEKVYRQRGYSHPQIAKQIFLCLRYASKGYSWGMNYLVSCQKEYNPEMWEEYGQEINKFLLFT